MNDRPAYHWSTFDTRFGCQAAAVDGRGRLVRYWLHADNGKSFAGTQDEAALEPIRAQVAEYCAGTRRVFDIPLHIEEGSDFDRAVWAAMSAIPFGETVSYGALARSLGDPNAARAVGVACNSNPIPLIVPCHRVIGADGALVGFGGGLPLKRALLDFESVVVGRPRDLFAGV